MQKHLFQPNRKCLPVHTGQDSIYNRCMKKIFSFCKNSKIIFAFGLIPQIGFSASLTEISISHFPSTVQSENIPDTIKPKLEKFDIGSSTRPSVSYYVLNYLSDKTVDQYGTVEKTKKIYPIIHKFDSHGKPAWSHFPRDNNKTLSGQIALTRTKNGIAYRHLKSDLLVQLDSNGLTTWENTKKIRPNTTKRSKHLQMIKNQILQFRPIKKSILTSNFQKSKNIDVDVLTLTEIPNGKETTVFNPLNHFDIWKMAEKYEHPFEMTNLNCLSPDNFKKDEEILCYFTTKKPAGHYELVIREDLFGKRIGIPRKLSFHESISDVYPLEKGVFIGIKTSNGQAVVKIFESDLSKEETLIQLPETITEVGNLSAEGSLISWTQKNETGRESVVVYDSAQSKILVNFSAKQETDQSLGNKSIQFALVKETAKK